MNTKLPSGAATPTDLYICPYDLSRDTASMTATEIALERIAAADIESKRKKSFDEEQADARQKKELTLPFRLYASSYAMARDILLTKLFRLGIGERKHIKGETLVSALGGTITHRGPELRQDDGGVFMALIAKTRGHLVTKTIAFNPKELVAEMGREHKDARYSVQHLRECIKRLQSSVIGIAQGHNFLDVVMVQRFVGDSQLWTVQLDSDVVLLFQNDDKHPTYIDIKKRARLKDGMQTYLQGHFLAHYEHNEFTLQELQEHSGSDSSLKVFGREVRGALPRLVHAGVIESYTTPRGSVCIKRVAPKGAQA